MIKVEKNLGHHHSREPGDELVMTYEQRTKGRIRITSAQGRELGLFLERGKVLMDGDCLEAEDGSIIRVTADKEPLIRGYCDSWELFSRCCYHLGNRHVPLQIGVKELWLQADHILSDMLTQLGMAVENCEAPFTPEQGAYSGGHHHAH